MKEEIKKKGFFKIIFEALAYVISKSAGYCGGKDSCGPTGESKYTCKDTTEQLNQVPGPEPLMDEQSENRK